MDNPAADFLTNVRFIPEKPTFYLIESYVKYLLTQTDCYTFPVHISRIVQRLQLPVLYVPMSDNKRGFLTPNFEIYINKRDRKTVQNFTLAHELIELLFLALIENEAAWLTDKHIQEFMDKKEDYCERGAAELHMPLNFFTKFIQESNYSIQTAISVAKLINLSVIAVMRQMLDTGMRECILVEWLLSHKPSDNVPSKIGQLNIYGDPTAMDAPQKLRVNRFWLSPSVRTHVKKNKSIENKAIIAQALVAPKGAIIRGYDLLEITSTTGSYFTESVRLSSAQPCKILSLIYLDDVTVSLS